MKLLQCHARNFLVGGSRFARLLPASLKPAAQMIFHGILLLVVVSFACINRSYAATPPAVAFSDSFEGTSIYPYWELTEEYGNISISKDVAYSGSHALKFSSTSGATLNGTVTADNATTQQWFAWGTGKTGHSQQQRH